MNTSSVTIRVQHNGPASFVLELDGEGSVWSQPSDIAAAMSAYFQRWVELVMDQERAMIRDAHIRASCGNETIV